jgi:hypothetical protein
MNPFKGMGRSRWGSAGLLYKIVKDPTPMLTRKCFLVLERGVLKSTPNL